MPRRAVVNKTSFQTLAKDLREGGFMNGGDTWDKDIPGATLLTNGPVLPLASHDFAYYGFERSLYAIVKSDQENEYDKKYDALLAKQLESSKLKKNDHRFIEEEHFSDKPPTKEFIVNNDNEITRVRLGHRAYQITKVCIPLINMNENDVYNLTRQSMKPRNKSSKIKVIQNSIPLHRLVLMRHPNSPKQNRIGEKPEKQKKIKSKGRSIVPYYYETAEPKIIEASVEQHQTDKIIEKQVPVVRMESEPLIHSYNLDSTIDEILDTSTAMEEEQQQILHFPANEINNIATFNTDASNNLPSATIARTKIQNNVCDNEKAGYDDDDQDILELYADPDDNFGIGSLGS